ncbi:galactoside alpha-(1,2)-fucosyltransferase 1-like [Saccostrea echinata]|uniref:galactoside alpha-(1,2)-fucosyltransferase 1-like n=1 Tax=Saccostrea echinata TaxID=191078 RepID=UPI002A7F8EC4|nr:galactoside alpha-(1,2)-fucosyltransferase 1-like [Saccostrea echinata]
MRRIMKTDFLLLILFFSVLINCFFFYLYLKGPKHRLPVQTEENRLCAYFRGGLGNNMFQYASTYGIARARNMTIGITPTSLMFNTFNISTKFLIGKQFCETAEKVVERRPCAYDKGSVHLIRKNKLNYIHKSYLQSWKYFQDVESEIREQFVFMEDVQHKAQTLIETLTKPFSSKNLTIVGVHIRRGDYKNEKNVKYGYTLATGEYVGRSLKYFRDRYKPLVFIVFTNPNMEDLKWCKYHIKGSDVVFAPESAREVDMCAISMCNHTVMTVGSFGWWGSFLANGTTVYFKNVARNDSNLRKDFSSDMSDYFYPGWIGLD